LRLPVGGYDQGAQQQVSPLPFQADVSGQGAVVVGAEVAAGAGVRQALGSERGDQTGIVCIDAVKPDHQTTSAGGAVSGNQRRPIHSATDTSRISTGTSTSGPMTAAKATGEVSPNAAMATAMASSKLFEAAVKARAVVRG